MAAHGPAAEEALEAMAASGTRADAARALVVVGEFKQALDTAPLPQVLKAVDGELHLGLTAIEEALITIQESTVGEHADWTVEASTTMREGTTHLRVGLRLLDAIR